MGAAGGLKVRLKGAQATRFHCVGCVPTSVPWVVVPAVAMTVVPVISFIAQRPMSPACAVLIGLLMVARISDCVCATFQILTSSRRPSNEPAATPVEFMAVASDACWTRSGRGSGVAAI